MYILIIIINYHTKYMKSIKCLCIAYMVSITLCSFQWTNNTNIIKQRYSYVRVKISSFNINSLPNTINRYITK